MITPTEREAEDLIKRIFDGRKSDWEEIDSDSMSFLEKAPEYKATRR